MPVRVKVADMAIDPNLAVLQLAAGQRLLISRRQCYAAGLNERQIRYRLQRKHWKQVHPHVFAVDCREPTDWEARVLAAVLSVPGAVASHRTALWLHGVRTLGRPEQIELSAPNGCREQREGVLIHQHRDLPPADTTVAAGIPVTTCARGIIDLAGTVGPVERLEMMDEAIYAEATTRSQLLHRARACRSGRAGVSQLIRALDRHGARRFRSWLEAEAARQWRAAGLPEPSWNVVVRDTRGRIGEVDALFPGGVVVVELDGLRFHSSQAQRRRDRARDRRLVLSGRVVLRFDWEDIVRRPHAVVDEIREALVAHPGPWRIPVGEAHPGG